MLLLLSVQLQLHAQDTAYARNVLFELCSDVLAGRGYVDDGDNEAAFFIEKQFKQIGLKPWDYNYYQSFNVSVNTFPGIMEMTLDGVRLTPGADYLIAADSPPLKSSEMPLTFLDRLPALAPSGRVIDTTLVLAGAVVLPDSLVSKLPRPMRLELLKGLKRSGAKVLIRSRAEKLTWHVSGHQAVIPEFTVNEKWLAARPTKVKAGAEAKLVKKHRTQNVLAYLPGSGDSDSTIVFTAHYDHLGKMGKQAIFRGANDNASGVTMLLTLAHHFSQPENTHRHNIAFIAFAAEELGLLGSSHYVEQPVFPLSDIVFLVNLDIVGTGEEGVKVVNGTVFREQFDMLTSVNERFGLLPKIESRGKASISDHHPFTEKGVPCFYMYTLGGSKAYHDTDDRPEGLSLAGFTGLFQLLVEFTYLF
jgi:aminopeptidase YwaD